MVVAPGGAIYSTYHLLGQPKSAKEISQVAGVNERTIKLELIMNKKVESGKVKAENLPDESRY